MLFWIVLGFITVILSFVYRDKIYLVWLFLFFVAAFRYKVGTDYMGYVHLFEGFQNGNFNQHYSHDFGLVAILNAIDFIGGSYQLLFIIYAVLTFVFFYKGFKYFSQNNRSLDVLFVLLFFSFLFFSTMHIIRFELAGAILFYSTRYIVEKRFFKYFLWVLAAALFHPTALVFILVYPVAYFKVNLKLILTFIILSTIIIIFQPMRHVSEYLIPYDLPYIFYITSEKYNVPASTFAIINTYIYMGFALLFYRYFTKNRIDNIIFILFLMFIFMRVLSFDLYIFSRFSLYFKPYLVLLLAYVLIKVQFRDVVVKWSLFLLLIAGSLYGSIYGLSAREGLQKVFYTQYAINIGLFGEPYIIDIYGISAILPNDNMETK